jgi:hypothetical protein
MPGVERGPTLPSLRSIKRISRSYKGKIGLDKYGSAAYRYNGSEK